MLGKRMGKNVEGPPLVCEIHEGTTREHGCASANLVLLLLLLYHFLLLLLLRTAHCSHP